MEWGRSYLGAPCPTKVPCFQDKVLCCISNSLTPHDRYVCERTNQQGPSVADREAWPLLRATLSTVTPESAHPTTQGKAGAVALSAEPSRAAAIQVSTHG